MICVLFFCSEWWNDILLVGNTFFLCVISQMGKHVVCGMECSWVGCVFLCHPIFCPPLLPFL